jgi:hypothetical protein
MGLKKLFPLLFVFCLSCSEKEEAHLPPAKMQQILYDIHLAEAYSTMALRDSTHRRSERNIDSLALYYATIFRHHKLSAAEFNRSLDWYKQHPEELDSIYTKMIPDMLKLETKYGGD